MTPSYRVALRDYLRDRSDAMAKTLAALVRIPTVNPYSGDPGPAGEAAGQRFLAARFRGLGGRVRWIPVPSDIYARCRVRGPRCRSWSGRRNLVVSFDYGPGPSVVLNAHMDTVGVRDFEGDPFSGRRAGGRIQGRGASDCKGGLVAGLYALEALRALRVPLRGRIVFESVVDEECNGSGAGTLACCAAGIRGRYAIALDGPCGLLYTGCQGVATVEISVRGRAGHGSAGGVSALEKLLLVKTALDRFAGDRARVQPGHAVNIGLLRAGVAPWTVPNFGALTANINYARSETAAGARAPGVAVRRQLDEIIARLAGEDAWLRQHPPRVDWIKDLSGFDRTDAAAPADGDRLIACAEGAMRVAHRAGFRSGTLDAWGDAAHLARSGRMAVVGMGAGEPGASHTASEFNRVANVRRTALAAALTLVALLGASSAPAGPKAG